MESGLTVKKKTNYKANLMNMLKKVVFTILSLFLVLACQDEKTLEKVEKTTLSPVSKTYREYDSIPLNHVSGLYMDDKSVFVSDHTGKRVLELDRSLNLVEVLATPGKGPCEVLTPARLIKKGESLFVFGNANKRFLEIDFKHDTCTTHTFNGRLTTSYDFLGEQIVLSSYTDENSLAFFDVKTGVKTSFGLTSDPPIRSKKNIYNYRHVAVNSSHKVFALPEGIPMIEVYAENGSLLGEHDLSSIPPIHSRLEFAQLKASSPDHNENTVYVLYDVVQKQKDKLYLLATDHFGEHESQLKTNTILVFDIQGDTPIWEGWYELDSKSPDGNHWYIAFDVYDEDLLAYDALQGELHYFSLE